METETLVKVNAGGTLFETSQTTLTIIHDSPLSLMFSSKFSPVTGTLFLDVSPEVFECILSSLRAVKYGAGRFEPTVRIGLSDELRHVVNYLLGDSIDNIDKHLFLGSLKRGDVVSFVIPYVNNEIVLSNRDTLDIREMYGTNGQRYTLDSFEERGTVEHEVQEGSTSVELSFKLHLYPGDNPRVYRASIPFPFIVRYGERPNLDNLLNTDCRDWNWRLQSNSTYSQYRYRP